MEALQHAVLLLPDEHREALQTLLYFLHDIAKHSATNSVTFASFYFFYYLSIQILSSIFLILSQFHVLLCCILELLAFFHYLVFQIFLFFRNF